MISSLTPDPARLPSTPSERVARAVSSDPSEVAPGDIAVGVVIGRIAEYFDYFVYGIASVLVFPFIFFPFETRLDGTLLSFFVFSFAFIARPIGTVLFMEIQRRWGRGTKLTLALFALGTSTVGIAFLPGYGALGYMAIVLLALLRVGQGIGLGGSWDGLPSLLAMSAPRHRRGWYAMMGQLGAPLGFMLASGLYLLLYSALSQEDFLSWGWRYPFFCAFAINVVALFARLRLVVADEYAQLFADKALEPNKAGELLGSQAYNVILGAFGALASYALFHVVTVFPLSWIVLFSDRSVTEFLAIQIVAAILGTCGVIASGVIADRIGRTKTLALSAALIAIFSGFSLTLGHGGTVAPNLFILSGFGLLGLSYGQAAGAMNANFEPRFRYTGAALTSDFAWLIGAGFAPLVALWLSSHFGLAYVSLYLFSGAVGTLAALWVNRKLAERD
jgi:MFS family permease